MIDRLWRTEPPPRATASLPASVSNLRRALESGRARRAPAEVPVSAAPGYAIRLPEDAVDALRFEAVLRRGADRVTGLHLLPCPSVRGATGTASGARPVERFLGGKPAQQDHPYEVSASHISTGDCGETLRSVALSKWWGRFGISAGCSRGKQGASAGGRRQHRQPSS
ncbi:hypothetical protein [Streptomyces canus]|uniref:AfsR/SARP family transcriptional regulator n=1 Tax=Streptomyces canus TaxID=58343 RepID=UPI00386A2F4B|nr:hypothetical protein OH824_37210 [Streptomyces canus]